MPQSGPSMKFLALPEDKFGDEMRTDQWASSTGRGDVILSAILG